MPLRFAIISDTHFVKPPTEIGGSWWNRTTEKYSTEMGDALVETMRELSPDFVIHCGDFTGEKSSDSVEFGLSIMDKIGCPWYGTPGNHDSRSIASRTMFKDRFNEGENSWSYYRDLGELHFFFLDVAHWLGADGSVSPYFDREKYDSGEIIGMGPCEEDLAWLERELEATETPAIVVTHAPIHFKEAYPLSTLPYGVAVKAPITQPKDFISGFVRLDEGRGRLLDIVRSHRNVVACLAGHWHINDALVEAEQLFLLTGSLRDYAYDIRLVEYDGTTFDISTHALDLPELRKLSYVEKWGNEWVRGTDDVRNFTFSLNHRRHT